MTWPRIFGSQIAPDSVITASALLVTELHAEYVTASVAHVTGSTAFGNTTGDRHSFTGSVLITGSFGSTGSANILGDLTVKGDVYSQEASGVHIKTDNLYYPTIQWKANAGLDIAGYIQGYSNYLMTYHAGTQHYFRVNFGGQAQQILNLQHTLVNVLRPTRISGSAADPALRTTGSIETTGSLLVNGDITSNNLTLVNALTGSSISTWRVRIPVGTDLYD